MPLRLPLRPPPRLHLHAGGRHAATAGATPPEARPTHAIAAGDPRPWLVILLALALGGCAANPNAAFQEAAEAQKRIQAETAPSPKATLDTQATYVRLVEQMQQGELWFASLAHIDALEQRWGVTPESTRLRADALRQTGQLTDAGAAYERLRGTPLAAAGFHGLGLLAGARSDFPLAVQLIEQARQLKPADPVVIGDLGYALLRAGDAGQARLRLMQALQLKPDSVQAQLNLALYFESRDETAQANAVMDAHRMNDALRAAVRTAAAQITGRPLPPVGAATPATPVTTATASPGPAGPATSSASSAILATTASSRNVAAAGAPVAAGPVDPAARPLTLKASGWSGLPLAAPASAASTAPGAAQAPTRAASTVPAPAGPALQTAQTVAGASRSSTQEVTP